MLGNSPTGLYTQDSIYEQKEPEIGPSTLREAFSGAYLGMLGQGPVDNVLLGRRISELQETDPSQAQALREARQTINSRISDYINRRPPGVIGATSVLLGSLAGFTSDPLNAALGLEAPNFIGTKAEELGSSLGAAAAARGATKSAIGAVRAAAAVGGGALEGAAIFAPGELSHLRYAHPFQDDFDSLDALRNIAYGAGLGAVLGGLGHTVGLMRAKALERMRETVPNQMEQDIRPDMGAVVRDGAVDAKSDITDEMVKNAEADQTVLAGRSEELDKEIEKARTELESNSPKDFVEAHDALPAADYVSRILRAVAKPEAERTAYEQSALMPEHQPAEVRAVLNRLRTSDAPMTPEEEAAVRNWQTKGEPAAQAEKAEFLKKQIKESPESEGLQQELKLTKRRMAAAKPVEENPIEQAQRNLEDLQSQKAQIGNLQDKNEAMLDFARSSIPPVDRTDLHEFSSHQHTFSGDDMAPKPDEVPLEKEASLAPEEPHEMEKEMEATIQQLEDEGQLTQDQLQKLDDVDTELREQANYKKLLAAAKNCLTRTLGL
jgi:hypothetical protein